MKKNYLFIGLAAVSMGIFAFQNDAQMVESGVTTKLKHKFSGGVADALTGAPGESILACTQCHNGSTLDGSQENSFVLLNAALQPVTSYNPGDTYNATIQMVSNPTKKGFCATALDPTDNMAGAFTGSGIGGTADFQTGGRDYATHTATSNTDAQTAWIWTWTAPATNVGDVTFYVATNSANDDGATSGDMIYLSQHVIGSVANVNEEEISLNSFNAGYNPTTNAVTVDFTALSSEIMSFNLVDMNGKSVFSKMMLESEIGVNEHTIDLPSSIENGMYVVNFFVGNNPMSANILVQK